jgi:CheY-like chemotaxis protein
MVSMKQGARILIVDDEAMIRQSITLLLEHDGHQVFPVDGGAAALAQLRQRKFDLVITDFSMPGMHGDELVARIRELVPTQPIIMATAFVEEFRTFGEASAHVDGLLLKPFSLKELREALEQVLTQGQSGQDDSLPPVARPLPPSDVIPPLET